MREKILLVSWLFPPGKSSSGFNLLKRIKNSGYEFDVLTAASDEKFHENLAMFRGSSSSFYIYNIIQMGSATDPLIRDNFIAQAVDTAEKLLDANHYRALMSHANEFASHLAAAEIKQRHPELRWIASYGDPYGGNPYVLFYPHNYPPELVEQERILFHLYDDVIVTNDYQKKLMLDWSGEPELADKFHVLPHAFDPLQYSERLYDNEKFIFSHIGMLYKHKRSSRPFIEAIKILAGRPQYRDRFHVNFVGADDIHIREYLENGGEEFITILPAVSYRVSLEMMADADALLLRDGDFGEEGYAYSPYFPGKLVDYIGAQKPILGVTMKEGFVTDFSREYPGLSCVSENEPNKLANHMATLIDGRVSAIASVPNLTTFSAGQIFREIINLDSRPKVLLIAGHKLNFIEPFIEYLKKNTDYQILIDQWAGHTQHNEQESRKKLEQADIIFCEWGLGNAVWYSNHKKPGQKLVLRIHRQEIVTPYLDGIKWENIDYVLTICPNVYGKILSRNYGIQDRLRMIYNLIDCNAYNVSSARNGKRLGFIGSVPSSKRLDLAVDLFVSLWEKEPEYTLHIKGKQPSEYSWIRSNQKESAWFAELYQKIVSLPCAKNIVFEPFGPDIPEFLARMDYMLSTSDFEGSHQVVAEGMGAGCIPVIRHWEGAEGVYPREFIFENIEEMRDFILADSAAKDRRKLTSYARERFDASVIAPQILELFK